MLKKLLACSVILLFLGFSASATNPKKNNAPSKKKEARKKIKNRSVTDRYCHVCCTVAVTNSDGETADATRCAGWLLTSCENAAEKACSKAREAVAELVP